MEDLNQYLDKTRENLGKLKELIGFYDEKVRALRKIVRDLLQKASTDEIPYSIRYEILMDTRDEAILILKKNARWAIEKTEEFNLSFFKDDLNKAIENPDTYKLTPKSGGKQIVIRIALDETAGTLHDYARGIKRARKNFKMNLGPEAASIFWAIYLYGAAREGKIIKKIVGKGKKEKTIDETAKWINRYYHTLTLRRQAFSKPAPWWSILEWGTQELSSNRGGESYPPVYEGTHFVENSRDEIIIYYENQIRDAIEKFHNELKKRIDEAEGELYEAMDYLKEAMSVDFTREDVANQIILDHLDRFHSRVRLENITTDMLNKIAESVLDDRGKRIYLGTGVPRVRTIEILRKFSTLVEDFLE